MDSTPPLTVRALPCGEIDLGLRGGERLRYLASGRRAPLAKRLMRLLNQQEVQRALEQSKKNGKVDLGDYNLLVEHLLRPRLNVRAQQIEINGELLSDAAFENLHVTLASEHQFRFRKADLQSSLRFVAGKSLFDPVAEELNGFATEEKAVLTETEWASIAQLCFGVEGELEGEVLRKWLISAVARVFDPGCKADQALVLKGKQGLGKSSFFSILGGRWFTDSLGDLSNEKDDRLLMVRFWICEWSEVDQVFRGAQKAEKVKQIITAQTDVFRSPYGRTPESHPRRGVLVGTTNRDDFLSDHTGNRRFPVIEPKTIDRDWLAANRERIWGRAVVEYRAGAQWHYTAEQEAEITRRAAAYAPIDPDAADLIEHFRAFPGRAFNSKEVWCLALQKEVSIFDRRVAGRLGRSLDALASMGIQSDYRVHNPPNRSHGAQGRHKVWFFPDSK